MLARIAGFAGLALLGLLSMRGSALHAQEWNLPLEPYRGELDHREGTPHRVVRAVAFLKDGRTLVTAGWFYDAMTEHGTAELQFLDRATGEVTETLAGTPMLYTVGAWWRSGASSLDVSADGRLLVVLGRSEPDPLTRRSASVIDVWNLKHRRIRNSIRDEDAMLYSISLSSDAKTLATVSLDGTIQVRNTEDGRLTRTIATRREIWPLQFSPNGLTLAAGYADGSTGLWDVRTGKEVLTLPALPGGGPVQALWYSPDGRRLAAGGGHHDATAAEVFVWDLSISSDQRLAPVAILRGHEGVVCGLRFSADGRRIATASHDKTARIWDIATSRELARILDHEDIVVDVAFSPDGRDVVTVGRDALKQWSVDELLKVGRP